MSSAFQMDGLLIKISKKIAVLLMKLPSLLMAEKIEPKILLMDKAVVARLIRSFFNNGGLFANYTYTISCYIIAVQEVVALKEQKYHLYLSDDEYRQTIQSLVRLKNNLIAQGRYTDGVDDVLCKVLSAKIPSCKGSGTAAWNHQQSETADQSQTED